MRIPVETTETSADYTFTRIGLRHALNDLGADFKEGPKEFLLRCFVTDDCWSGKKSLYLVHRPRDGSISRGMWHCFKCNESGLMWSFVENYTAWRGDKWNAFKISAFLRKHRASGYEELEPLPPPREMPDSELDQYAYRHPYCYERKLTEQTLRRYRIGYDKENNDIILPWHNRVGKLIAIKRRSVLAKHYMFEGDASAVSSLLFGLHLVRPRSIVWMTEGEFDAMFLDQTFREYRLRGHAAVALGGKYLHAERLQELNLKAPSMIVLALDCDADGEAQTQVITSQLTGLYVMYRMQFQSGIKDPNDSDPVHILVQAQKAVEVLEAHTRRRSHS